VGGTLETAEAVRESGRELSMRFRNAIRDPGSCLRNTAVGIAYFVLGIARLALGSVYLVLGTAWAAEPDERLSLQEALQTLERDGLTIFYSSSLVRPELRVAEGPDDGDPRDRLDALLEPFGLAARPGPRGSVLIVRAPPGDDPVDPVDDGLSPARTVPSMTAGVEEIVVMASRYRLDRAAGTSPAVLTHSDIEHSPDIGDDALRPIARLPGNATNGFSARSHVRGGEAGEAMIRFDGLRLYEAYHLQHFQGVFSAVDPRIVQSMTVYTGVFPAVYGDRLSSVVDIASLSPPDDRYYEAALSFFNTSVLSAGTFADRRGEWVTSFRRSNLDLLYSAFSAHEQGPRYVDAYAKLSYEIGDRFRVTGNFLAFNDDISLADDVDLEEQAFSNDRNRYAWLRVDHGATPRLTGATLLAHTRLGTDRFGETAKEGISSGTLDDRRSFDIDSLQSEWTWDAGERVAMTFGGTVARTNGRYDYRDDARFDVLFDAAGTAETAVRSRSIETRPEGEHLSVYASVVHRPVPRLTIDLGLRREAQRLDSRERRAVDPRAAASVQITDATVLKLAWGRFHQFQNVTELEIEDPLGEFHAPQRAEQTVIALEHVFPTGLGMRVEAYDKRIRALRPRYENLLTSLTLLPELKADRIEIAPDSARSAGVELSLSGQPSDAVRWRVAYSRARVEDRFADRRVARSWDQRHAISAGIDWDTPTWNLAVGLLHRSGWPRTSVLGFRAESDPPRVVTGPRNGARSGAYQSLDLRLSRKFQLATGSLTAFLEISNAFDKGNTCCVEYEAEENQAGELGLEISDIDYAPRLPSIGFVFTFGRSRAD
jgi:hypothetical protein